MTSGIGAREPASSLPPNRSSGPSFWRERALQLAVAVLAAAPLAWFSVSQMISYDGYWHVFIAIQDTWYNFAYEVAQNAHPPLFYLLLGGAITFGKIPIVYRAISILATVGSTCLIGRIVRRSGASLAVSVVASVAFAVSWSTMVVGVEVRWYQLGIFFSLLAVHGFLELAAQGFGEPSPVACWSFALGIPLALLTHYSSVFVLARASSRRSSSRRSPRSIAHAPPTESAVRRGPTSSRSCRQ